MSKVHGIKLHIIDLNGKRDKFNVDVKTNLDTELHFI